MICQEASHTTCMSTIMKKEIFFKTFLLSFYSALEINYLITADVSAN